MTFQYIQFAWLFLLLPVCWWLLSRKRLPAIQVPEVASLKNHGVITAAREPFIPRLLVLLTGGALIVGMMQPVWTVSEVQRIPEGNRIVVALDVSGSMAAFDRMPEQSDEEWIDAIGAGENLSRLGRAKQVLALFFKQCEYDEVGLLVFADYTFLASPLTRDFQFITQQLDQLQPGEFADGTDLSKALLSSLAQLRGKSFERAFVILLTDGQHNMTSTLSPLKVAEVLKRKGVSCYTVGIGSNSAALLQKTPAGVALERIEGRYDAEILRRIASETGGAFFGVNQWESFQSAFAKIRDRQEVVYREERKTTDHVLTPWCFLLALCLFALAIALRSTVFLTYP